MTTLKADKFTPTMNYDVSAGSEYIPKNVKKSIDKTLSTPD